MGVLITRQVRISYDLAAVICALAAAHGATKIAQIGHVAVVPEEWINGRHASAGVRSEAGIRTSHDDARTLVITAGSRYGIRATQA